MMLKNTLLNYHQNKFNLNIKGYNSFVSNESLDQIQLDLADFTKNAEENDGYRFALVGVDVFSRYGWLVPMKTKQPNDVINAFKEIMRVFGVPKSAFSDLEGAIVSDEFIRVLNEDSIKPITTLSLAPYAEVSIRITKQLIHERSEGLSLNLD